MNTKANTPALSIGIIAWNEEDAIGAALRSIFGQSLFTWLTESNLTCEILCVANGCTDATARVAEEVFATQRQTHYASDVFQCRLVNLPERGKLNAWNVFVHKLSAPTAQFLFLMDGDIILHHPDTLRNMVQALQSHAEATIAVDQPLKEISLKSRLSWWEKISLSNSALTHAGTSQVTGQLYCIRAGAARNIYLPRDLAACEDGFIKAVVCTDFLTHPGLPNRIIRARNASHVFESYLRPADILRNQKRQMIGQTIVHLLVDKYLVGLSVHQRTHLGEWLRYHDTVDPMWLKRLIGQHLRQARHFWRLYPGLLSSRFERLARVRGLKRFVYAPVALIGFLLAIPASWQAFRALKRGCTDYWPDTKSRQLEQHLPTHKPTYAA